jgi:hypothetical protein
MSAHRIGWRQDVGVAACVMQITYALKRNCVSKSLAKSAITRQLKICEQKQVAMKLKLLLLKLPKNRIHHPIEVDLSVAC